jgi:hypothetical protein
MWWTVRAPGDESPFDLSDLVWQQTKAILEREGYVVVDPLLLWPSNAPSPQNFYYGYT